MKKTTNQKSPDGTSVQPAGQLAFEQEISRRAYDLWEADGCPHGAHETHWLRAENEARVARQEKSAGEKF